MPRAKRRSSRDSRRDEAAPYGSTGLSSRLDDVGIGGDSTREPTGMAPIKVQSGKEGKMKDGERTGDTSMDTRLRKMMSFRKTGSKVTLNEGDGDGGLTRSSSDDGGLTRSSSMFRATSIMKSGALTGTTQPTKLNITVKRSLGNRVGLALNKRNRITGVDPGTPAAKAGLLAFDLVLSVNDQTAKGELSACIEPSATELVFHIERPHKSQHRKIVIEENATEKEKEMVVDLAGPSEPEKPAMPRQKTETTKALAAAGFALQSRSHSAPLYDRDRCSEMGKLRVLCFCPKCKDPGRPSVLEKQDSDWADRRRSERLKEMAKVIKPRAL